MVSDVSRNPGFGGLETDRMNIQQEEQKYHHDFGRLDKNLRCVKLCLSFILNIRSNISFMRFWGEASTRIEQ